MSLPAVFSSAVACPPAAPRLGVEWQCAGLIRRCDFAPEQQIPAGRPDDPVMSGQLRRLQLQAGLWLLCAETQELSRLHTRSMAEGGLRVVVVLDGCMDLSFGDCHVRLDTAAAGGRACGSLIHTRQPQPFERWRASGHSERRLSLYLTPQWLAAQAVQTPELQARQPAFWQAAAAARAWQPSPRAVALAEQILQLSKAPQGMDGLRLTGLVLELVHEALESALAPQAVAPAAALRPRDHERLMRLRQWLEQDEGEGTVPPLPAMARQLGLSLSALQRQFRQAFDCSIEAYRRDARLQRAYVQLQRGGRSVAQVADAAGYTSAANFATAFKRKYGLSPKQVRATL